MKFLFASDSFKGSLSSEQTIHLLTRAAHEVFGDADCLGLPVADGGEGTVDAVIAAENGTKIYTEVHDPLFRKIRAGYGQLSKGRCIIEMAAASGLPLLSGKERDPWLTSTYGTGELIKDALDRGFREITLAIGGSATNDGGMGCARALGVRFLDSEGRELPGRGCDLEKAEHIDVSGLDPRILSASLTVMCDVTNPLTGPSGATYTFSAQKGADADLKERLEKGMQHYRSVLIREFGQDPDETPGSGAAGGLGTALMIFLKGTLRSGIETVLDLIHLDERLEDVDLVVTGEGRTDWQSCFGKVMQGVGDHAAKKGIPCVGLCGSLGEGAEQIFDHGISSLMTTINAPMPLQEAIERAEELYYGAAVRMFRILKAGSALRTD